jgi:hypothetical protein
MYHHMKSTHGLKEIITNMYLETVKKWEVGSKLQFRELEVVCMLEAPVE